MANSRGPSTTRNMMNNGRHSLLPPKCPFPTIAPSYGDYISTSVIGVKGIPKYRDGNAQHHLASSESLLAKEQPSWLDELLNEPESPVQRGHRRSSSGSFTYLEAANAATQNMLSKTSSAVDLSSGHGPNHLVVTTKARRQFLGAIQEAVHMEFPNATDRRSITVGIKFASSLWAVAPGVLDLDIFGIQTLHHAMSMSTWVSTMSLILKGCCER